MVRSFEELIDSGLALVPIPRGKKGPRSSGWNLKQNVINSSDKVSLLKGMNVGLAHAYCSPTPTCSVDIDNGKQALEFLRNAGIDLIGLIKSTSAPTLTSGNSLKLKLFFRLPMGEPPLATEVLKNDEQVFLEFRCATKSGLTVQDVLPGSLHPTGVIYTLLKGDFLKMPVIPGELLALWKSLGERKKEQRCISKATPDEETPRAIARLKAALEFIAADCDYETWRNVVWGILHTNWSVAIDIAEDWSRSAPERFDQDAFELLVGSYDPHHESPITTATVFHLAKKGGWYAGSI